MLSDKICDFVSQFRYKKCAVLLIFPSEHSLPDSTVFNLSGLIKNISDSVQFPPI